MRSEKLTVLVIGLLFMQTALLGVLLWRIDSLERLVLSAASGGSLGAPEAEEVVDVDPGNGPTQGAAAAPVTIVEFSCFTCPACADLQPGLKETLSRHPGKIRLAFRYFPLRLEGKPILLAKAAECARTQGKFWEAHDLLFSKGLDIEGEKALVEAMAPLGLDPAGLSQCLASKETEARVRADFEAGRGYGVNSTPTLFVNGRRIQGADLRILEQVVESSLEKGVV